MVTPSRPLPPVKVADDAAIELGQMLSALTGDGAYLAAAEQGQHPLAIFRGYTPATPIDLPTGLLPQYRTALSAMGPGAALYRNAGGGWVVLPAPHPDNTAERVLGSGHTTSTRLKQSGWAILANPPSDQE